MACSSSSGSATNPSASGSTNTGASTAPTSPANGTPIKLGYLDSSQGLIKQPQLLFGSQAAVNWVNNHGGINGHPIDLVTCQTDGSPAPGTACANKLVTQNVIGVIDNTDLSSASEMPILSKANIPVAGVVCSYGITPNLFDFCQTSQYAYRGYAGVLKAMGSKNVEFIVPDYGTAVTAAIRSQTQAQIGSLGIKTSVSIIPVTSSDVTAAVAAAKSSGADTLAPFFNDVQCGTEVPALRSLGWTGKILLYQCTSFIKPMGAAAAGINLYSYTFPWIAKQAAIAYDPSFKSEYDLYDQIVTAANPPAGYHDSTFTGAGVSSAMTVLNLLKTISGPVTSASITSTLAAFKGNAFLGLPMDCTTVTATDRSCGNNYLVGLVVQKDGTLGLIGGKPVQNPPLPTS